VRDPEMLIHGLANDVFLDDKRFSPIFERAQALDVPLYLHPSVPLPAVMDAYYKDYAKDFPMVVRAAWGYTVETATQAIRLVLGGVFEAYPRLKVVLGHLGETLPFLVWRVDHALARPGAKTVSFPRGLLRSLLHYETLAFSQEPDHARTSFQERERYATAFIGIARRSPGGQAPGG
jgi:hypothetical protein